MSSVEVRDLWKSYTEGASYEVKGINFRCTEGEFIALLGPSGCGKSTTLRMIAGLEEITKGELLFDDQVVNHLNPRQRNVALAFESYALYPPLTVFENIAFPLRASGMNKAAVDKEVKKIAEWLELEEILKRKPSRLSGGQQQRVSLARALVRKPSVLLLDEPLSHMDQRVRFSIRARIRRIHDDMSATTIYVTHDQEEAVSLADRIIVMDQGEIQQMGTAEELTHRPVNEFVAGFIGEPAMNFIRGECENESKIVFNDGEISVSWPAPHGILNDHTGKPVLIGFRPDKVKISLKAIPDGLKALVRVVEYMGEEKIVTMELSGSVIKAICPEAIKIKELSPVWISCDLDDMHIFDTISKQALSNGKGGKA